MRGGGLIGGVTQVLRKRWAYLQGRGLIGGELRYVSLNFHEVPNGVELERVYNFLYLAPFISQVKVHDR